MNHNVFLLATDPNNPRRDVIHSRDSGLKVKVICVSKEKFEADVNEIQLFGYASNQLYIFESIQITAEQALSVLDAVEWYACYIEQPDMEILPEDPRFS